MQFPIRLGLASVAPVLVMLDHEPGTPTDTAEGSSRVIRREVVKR